jgi:hypothetical protein
VRNAVEIYRFICDMWFGESKAIYGKETKRYWCNNYFRLAKLPVAQIVQRSVVRRLVRNGLEVMWKQAVILPFDMLSRLAWDGSGKPIKALQCCFPAQVRTRHFSNTGQTYYRLSPSVLGIWRKWYKKSKAIPVTDRGGP